MDNKHKWLVRLIYALSFATLILIVGLGFLIYTSSGEVKRLHESLNRIEQKAQASLSHYRNEENRTLQAQSPRTCEGR
jgi:hypothetical protein